MSSDLTKALPLGPALTSRDALVAYIAQNGHVAADAPPHWHFVPMAGTTVLFDSSARADSHLPGLATHRACALSLTPQGFRRFRLHL